MCVQEPCVYLLSAASVVIRNSFVLISKQAVSVFQNNRNKQKTNRNSRKFVKISTFLIPHTISSVCFSCFDTGPEHRNKPKKKFLVLRNNKPKNNRNRLFRFESRKKTINSFEDLLIENVFWRFFCLFRQSSVFDRAKSPIFFMPIRSCMCVRYHSGGSMKLNACILLLAHMVYI